MNQEQEELKEFWEWCGIYLTARSQFNEDGFLRCYPDGTIEHITHIYHLEPDLNNLFKYAVPILISKVKLLKVSIILIQWLDDWLNEWKVVDPAQALYKAIKKVFNDTRTTNKT